MRLTSDDALAGALIGAIRAGDLDTLRRLLADTPGLASAALVGRDGTIRTPLHVAADWPGYFPGGPVTVRLLIVAGADPDAPVEGAGHAETALHWAASSDDLEVAAALVDGGADIEARGASIGGGSPLEDAVGYGCWHVARFLVSRGAHVDHLWIAAALGLDDRVDALLGATPPPDAGAISEAFWQACHGGQRRTAARLLDAGADIDATPGYAHLRAVQIAGQPDTRREGLVAWLIEQGAADPG